MGWSKGVGGGIQGAGEDCLLSPILPLTLKSNVQYERMSTGEDATTGSSSRVSGLIVSYSMST